ncbi:hypothetical protein TNCT_215901 [Trichonephila clavata]|uniref:Uncharacterized protein n=1 Tax=Trichonephila clavata TaxID=2740835 RepID=A0A8X6IIL5_TRICU|nr:hypothetical protein TNCT_215901 [Trichonephila clavata]
MAVLSAGSRPPSGHAPVVRADDVEYTLAYLKRHPSLYPHHHLLIKEREGVVRRLSNISYEVFRSIPFSLEGMFHCPGIKWG